MSLREVVFTRLDALDKATAVAHEDAARIPTELDKQIANLKALVYETFKTVDEKFAGIATQFSERDVRVRESAASQTTAVSAALQAAKEAVGEANKSFMLSIDKSEKSTLEQIAQQRLLLQSVEKSLGDKIGANESRMTRQESLDQGASGARLSRQSSGGYVASIIFGIIGAGGILFGILMALLKR